MGLRLGEALGYGGWRLRFGACRPVGGCLPSGRVVHGTSVMALCCAGVVFACVL